MAEQADHLATSYDLNYPWLCHRCSESVANNDDYNKHKSTTHPPLFSGADDMYTCTLPVRRLNLVSEKTIVRDLQQDHAQQAARMEKAPPRGCDQRGSRCTNESCAAFNVYSLHRHQPTCAACGAKFEVCSELATHMEGPGKDGACAPTAIEPHNNASPPVLPPSRVMRRRTYISCHHCRRPAKICKLLARDRFAALPSARLPVTQVQLPSTTSDGLLVLENRH